MSKMKCSSLAASVLPFFVSASSTTHSLTSVRRASGLLRSHTRTTSTSASCQPHCYPGWSRTGAARTAARASDRRRSLHAVVGSVHIDGGRHGKRSPWFDARPGVTFGTRGSDGTWGLGEGAGMRAGVRAEVHVRALRACIS